MSFSRREVGRLALAGLPGFSALEKWRSGSPGLRPAWPSQHVQMATAKRPNSVFGGVQVGIIVPYSLGGVGNNPEVLLKAIVELGLNAVELQSEAFEAYLGAPQTPPVAPAPTGGRGTAPATQAAGRGASGLVTPPTSTPAAAPGQAAAPTGRAARPLTPEQVATQARDALRRWRLSAPVEKFRALRTRYDEAGVDIQIVTFGLDDLMSDQEMDYCFQAAKWLGAGAITCEPPVSQSRRIGLFAEKHRMRVGYRGRANVTSVEAFGRPGSWEQAFFYSPYNGASIDVGHFMAGNSKSAAGFIQQYHERITNIHLKDRRVNQGPNMPWGQGDTPIREILQLIKREKYPFMATIELEYPVPDGSTVMAEVARCVEYCRDALA
jgi:hypothetical protein